MFPKKVLTWMAQYAANKPYQESFEVVPHEIFWSLKKQQTDRDFEYVELFLLT